MELTAEKRNELLLGDEARITRNLSPRGFAGDASTAPDWAKERIIEIRHAIIEKREIPAPSPRFLHEREQRMTRARYVVERAARFAKRVFSPMNEDAALRAKADAVLAEIRRDELRVRSAEFAQANHFIAVRDASGRVVRFEINREKEAERKLIETGDSATLLKLLEAKIGMREQPGSALSAQPGSTPCTACSPDAHAKAATYHRTKAANAASWQEGAAHHSAADAHAKAADQFNADNSVAARSASEKVFEDWDDDDDDPDKDQY